jgi:hypothetical protein
MNRPKGLLLTAWIMVGFLLAGLLREWFWPPHPHITHLHTLTSIIGMLIRIAALICIFYYAQGRNLARIAVLAASVVEILSLLRLRHEDTLGRVVIAAAALLAVFFLYWPVRSPVLQAQRGYYRCAFYSRARFLIQIGEPTNPNASRI